MSKSYQVTGKELKRVRKGLRRDIFKLALKLYGNPIKAMKALKMLVDKRKRIQGYSDKPKMYKVDDKYYWNIAAPGWPSPAFDLFITNEMKRISVPGFHQLQTIIFSITSRCPLHCEHCYEWNNLSAEETLSFEQIQTIQSKFEDYGITNIQLSGGEPLARFDDLIKLVKNSKATTDMWILTSGFGLNEEKADRLKKAGLTGVVVSLDHWKKDEHNKFRQHDSAYDWVLKAIDNAREAGLVVALSLCAVREFVSKTNLERYMELAKEHGVSIVRILEPRKTGHYAGMDIELSDEEIATLYEIYLDYVNNPAHDEMPMLEYTGYHQRHVGCFGGGIRYLYVDSKADIHACPFCQGKRGNALEDELKPVINKLRQTGCHKFEKAGG